MVNSKQKHKCQGFLNVVFSWSLSDVLNNNLYKSQVEEVPLTFSSTSHYKNSFINLLLEETRADLSSQLAGISQAPASPISGLQRTRKGSGHNNKQLSYRVTLLYGMNYEPRVGDLIALTRVKPKCVDDVAVSNHTSFLPAYVTYASYESPVVEILSSNLIESSGFEFDTRERPKAKAFVVYLTNLTTNMRIWEGLNADANMNMSVVIQRTFSSGYNTRVIHQCCIGGGGKKSVIDSKVRQAFDSFKLDSSQEAAVLSCLAAKKCCHENSSTELIWGPPGTGKTKTVASLLFLLLRTKHRTLTCAPTNIAVVGVAKRLLSLLHDHDLGCDTFGFGDIVLFGNKERMKIKEDHEELFYVFLDNRIKVLGDGLCVWKTCTTEMIRLLENPMIQYQRHVVIPKKTKIKSKKNKKNKKNKKDNEGNSGQIHEENQLTFEEFAMNRFSVLGRKLIDCIRNLYTHLPTSVIPLGFVKKMNHSIDLIKKVVQSVMEIVTANQSLEEAFQTSINPSHMELRSCRKECLQALNDLRAKSLIPNTMSKNKLKQFCLLNACLIFCTASNSIKLYRKGMTPIKTVVIDEAAQLKECESVIPLQLPGVQKAVLVGDERQLPSMVQSKICEEAMFGRSLFERLVLLGHKKHLLNVQYRMHPSISRFPNAQFYNGQIFNAPSVTDKTREKRFLQHEMYGPYSFINVDYAKEELDKNSSTKNMVEVAVIEQIVANLFKESFSKKQTLSVGCISPYKAQVIAIQAKLGEKYNCEANGWSFSVNVGSVDGFQGSEEDVIIFSTVRCNPHGSIGFLSSRERANVALTRARHCLWIVGNKETMVKSGSVWTTLVQDAENRGCIFDAHGDKNLAHVMVNAMIESPDFVSLLKTDSILFNDSKWNVIFATTFLKRATRIRNLYVRKQVVSLLVKLSNGWRQSKKNKTNRYANIQGMLDVIEIYNVDGHLQLVWSVDMVYENSLCVQVLKFWDIVPLSKIRVKRFEESAFGNYTSDMIIRCQTKSMKRNLVFPMTWTADAARDTANLVLTSQLSNLSLSDL